MSTNPAPELPPPTLIKNEYGGGYTLLPPSRAETAPPDPTLDHIREDDLLQLLHLDDDDLVTLKGLRFPDPLGTAPAEDPRRSVLRKVADEIAAMAKLEGRTSNITIRYRGKKRVNIYQKSKVLEVMETLRGLVNR